MRNKAKSEYEKSGAERVEMNRVFSVWWYRLGYDFDLMLRLTGRNDAEFTKAFGKSAFTWISSSGQKAWAWRFSIDESLCVYVFSGTRGTSYEFAARDPWSRDVGKKLIEFVTTTILPAIKET